MKRNAVWKLPKFLKDKGISAYKLHKLVNEGEDSAAKGTIYRWAKELPDTLDVALLMGIITVLRDVTGDSIEVEDLLEYET